MSATLSCAQVDSIEKVMQLSWEVTAATLAAGAASGGQGATTIIFAPVQGFFAVPKASQLDIQVLVPFRLFSVLRQPLVFPALACP